MDAVNRWFSQVLSGEVLFRLEQEGYILLITLLLVFTASVFAANVVALVLTMIIRSVTTIDAIRLRLKTRFAARKKRIQRA